MARKIEVELVGDARSLTSAFSRTQTASSRLERNLGRLGHMTKLAIGTGVGVGLVGLAFAAHGAIKEFADAQKVTAQTNAVLKSTGGIANVTRKHVDALGSSLLRKSGIDDEAIKSGENMLLTFKHIRNEAGKGNDIFDQATRAVTDMDVAMSHGHSTGESLSKTAIRIGKALQDPIKGSTALARVGVQFSEAQKKQIKAFVDSGHAMDAQKLILRELNSEFGGSAAALGKTIPGQISIFRESLRNIGADIVGKFVPVLLGGMKVAERFGHFIGQIAHAKNIAVGLKVTATGIKNFASSIKDALAKALFGFSDQATAGGAVVDKGLAGFAGRFHDGLMQKLMKQDWKTIGGQIATGISASLTFSADALNGMLNTMLAWVNSHATQIAAVGAELAVRIVTTLTDPAFWAHHLDILAGVILLAFGGSIGRAAGRMGGVIIARLGPVFSRAFGELALIGMRGIARLPGFLGDAIAAAGTVVLRAARGLWREVIGATAKGVAGAGQEAGKLATFLGRALRLGVVVTAFRLAFSKMEGIAGSAGHAIASGISSALGTAGRVAHTFAGAVTTAMHTVMRPIHTVINAIQTLWTWLQKVRDFTIHIHIPTPHVPHISLPHIPHPGNPFGAAGGVVVGGTRGRDSVGAVLMPGEVVVPVPLVQKHGGPQALMDRLGFQRMAKGGVAGKKHRAPKLPSSIREAEAKAAGTPGLGDDISAYSKDLAWTNQELGRHDLTGSERESLRVHRIRVQNRLTSLRRRQSQQKQRDYSQLPAGLQLAISNARLALAQAVNAQQRNQARAALRAALWNAKHWLDRQLLKRLSPAQRASVIDAITSIVEEINGLTDDDGSGGSDSADLQAQLDQARQQASVADESARLANAFVATGAFGSSPGGGANAPVQFNFLIPDAEQIRRATEAIAQGAGAQPYRTSSVVKTGY